MVVSTSCGAGMRPDVDDERTTEQEIASGRPSWTPFALLGSVAGVVFLLVVIVVALAAIAYFLA